LSPKFICFALLVSGFAFAQTQKPEDVRPKDATAQDQQNPDDQTQQTTYAGPSILSRDKSLIGERGGKLLDFRFFGEVTGIYDSGLTPVTTDSQGNLVNVGGAEGVEAGFGVIGSKRWKRDQLSIDYKGSYRRYNSDQAFNGTDQLLNLSYSRILTRRITLDLKETAGTVTLANGTFSYLPLTNTDLFAVPANELFDNRTNFLQSRVDLTWQESARLSFGVGGEGFVVRRASLLLAGLNGYSARANVAYRISKRQTLSASYNHSYYDFQRQFGDANLDTMSLGYSLGLSRKWDFGLDGGVTHIEDLGLRQVSLDPAIAALVGQSFATVTFHAMSYIPNADIRLIRRFDRSSLSIAGSIGATPGNGVYLTSKQETLSTNYSYSGYRRLTVGFTFAYSKLSAVGQTLGTYDNYTGGFGSTFKLSHDTHLQFRYDYRRYTTQNAIFQKDSQRLSLGFAFSPGEKPLAIW
jgi:hypothetical protein